MLFGDRQRFAVEVRPDLENIDRLWVFGTCSIWLGGCEVADPRQVESLRVVAQYFMGILEHAGERSAPELEGCDAESLFELLDDGIYGELTATLGEAREFSRRYRRHMVHPSCPPFEDLKAFCFELPDGELIVWRLYGGSVHETRLERGEMDRVLGEYCTWFEATFPYDRTGDGTE